LDFHDIGFSNALKFYFSVIQLYVFLSKKAFVNRLYLFFDRHLGLYIAQCRSQLRFSWWFFVFKITDY